MKKMFLGICFCLAVNMLTAQTTTIQVVDEKGNPVSNASVEIEKLGKWMADETGKLVLRAIKNGSYSCTITSIGYNTFTGTLVIPSELISFTLQKHLLFLEPVEIKALRASDKSPFSKTNLKKSDIEKQNLAQDLPFIMQQTPSLIVTSDAGNGVGYTGMRIRGTDATRINVTINGIPYNDAESQGTFFVDMPDFASSLSSIQIQRGVGTSTNGAGAFGASVNLSTNEFIEKPYAEINNSYGSFNTRKHTVKAGTGLIGKHFTVDARLSKISSDGFVNRGTSDLQAYYVSAAYISKKTSLRLNAFSGKEKTYQAWNGIPEAKLFNDKNALLTHYYNNLGVYYFTPADSANLFSSDNRRFNMFTYKNQTDNYWQDHYQFFVNHRHNDYWLGNLAVYVSNGKGYYEEFKNDARLSNYNIPNKTEGTTVIKKSDLVRQLWLDNQLLGSIGSLQYKKEAHQLTIGGGINQYKGSHFGKVVWTAIQVPLLNQLWYHYKGIKKDANAFVKYQYAINKKLQVLADVQFRKTDYEFSGTRKFPSLAIDAEFEFWNPKLGISYQNKNINWYASWAVANKEPNRSDYETGTAAGIPNREQLFDWELGAEKTTTKYSWAINGYYMKYKDQLVLTGKINDVGDPVRINVPKSYRLGIEAQAAYTINSILSAQANLTFSRNQIINYSDFTPRYDANFELVKQDTSFFTSTPLAFSPNWVGSGNIQVLPFKNAVINWISKWVSAQYLDNTGSMAKQIKGYWVNDCKFQYTIHWKFIKEINFIAQLNNILNWKYETNGYTYSYVYDNTPVRENFYYPMAGRNIMGAINIRF